MPNSSRSTARAGFRELKRHTVLCGECLEVFSLIVLHERPATAEEEAILDELWEVTAEGLRQRASRR
jgi:hypothetical protein